MKRTNNILLLLILCGVFANTLASVAPDDKKKKGNGTELREKFDGEEIYGTYADVIDTTDTVIADKPYNYYVETRGYNDRIVVRWMADDYMPLRLLNKYGACLIRLNDVMKGDSIYTVEDTIARCVKPLSLEEFQSRFGANDSLAAAAAQTIYGRSVSLDQTEAPAGSMGSLMEVWEQQQELFGFAGMIAERRPDLAEAMGLSFTDRTAKNGIKYQYLLRPLFADSTINYRVHTPQNTALGDYKPVRLSVNITDSITPPLNVTLYWMNGEYSAFDIERSKDGGEWQKLNQQPYVFFQHEDASATASEDVYFQDQVPGNGKYEYRVYAYDLFGDRTEPSEPHKVEVKDITPPAVPMLNHIDILRSDTSIQARLFFKTQVKDPDLKGFMPFYQNEKIFGEQWIPLTNELLAPDDTVTTVNVTGLGSGYITIAAVDYAGNISRSAALPIDIADMKAPGKPTNLRYTTDLKTGTVRLVWDAPEDKDIMHYQVLTANDTTHMFIPVTSVPSVSDTVFIDTLKMDVNQRYIYYKVCAVDYSTNQGEFSDVIQVLRPSHLKPQTCHLDSAWQDKQYIHMRWIASDEAQVKTHYVYRREENEKQWTLLQVLNADSVKAEGCIINLQDRPRPSANRWEYAIESWSFSDISSGPSLTYSCFFNGYKFFDCPAKLQGIYNAKEDETRLAWDITGDLPDYDKWYWCVYRKGPKDKRHKFLLSAPKDSQDFSDQLLRENETAEYYITLMMPGIGESKPSNIITVKHIK